MRSKLRLALDAVRTVWKVAIAVVIVYFALSVGFWWSETHTPCAYFCPAATPSLGDSLWWGIATLSTVGYGDVIPHTLMGRIMGAGLMLFQIGFLGYLLSVILGAVTDIRLKALTGSLGTDMKEHVVVCGFTQVGKSAVRELLASGQPVAVVCETQDEVGHVRALGPEEKIFACSGNVNNEETLSRANIAEAHAVIFCTADDTTNMIGALLSRSQWPSVRVVVSVQRSELRRTLKTAGVTYVASPDDMGGRLCSSAAFRPEVASAVEDLTTATYGADIQEYRVLASSPIAKLTLPEAEKKVREASDCLILGIIRPTGAPSGDGPEYQTEINPSKATRFDVGNLVLVVGSLENLGRFEKWYGTPKGAERPANGEDRRVPIGWPGYAALAVFGGAYALFALREEKRTYVAAVAAGLGLLLSLLAVGSWSFSSSSAASGACALFGYTPSGSPWHVCATPGVMEWDTLGLLIGLFLLAALLQQQKVFSYLALRLAHRSGDQFSHFLFLSLLSFVLSAFINSITVMVVLATITLELCRAMGRSPVNLLLAEISCSNVGGAATFVGDPPNVILGTYFGLGFDAFLEYAAPLALAALAVTLLLFGLLARRDSRKEVAKAAAAERDGPSAVLKLPPVPVLDRPQVAIAGAAFGVTLGLLAVNQFIPPSVGEIGLIGGALALLIAGRGRALPLLKGVDWSTLAFFFFLFLLVGSLEFTGVIAQVAAGLGSAGGGSALLLGIILLWTLGLLSSVVDNVPLAAAAGPVIAALHSTFHYPIGRLVYPSAVGTDVGGNGTPIGASANVVALAIAKKEGTPISWKTYLVRAFPIMVLSLLAASAVLLFWP